MTYFPEDKLRINSMKLNANEKKELMSTEEK
jgi:hypothetical protein